MVELSVFGVVAGFLWSSSVKAGCMLIAIFLLLKVPYILDSSDEYTTLRVFLYSVWIGLLLLVIGFNGRGEGQSLI